MSAVRALAGSSAVPRWRLLRSTGLPQRLARHSINHLLSGSVQLAPWGQPRYAAVAPLPCCCLLLVAACEQPVGCALCRLHETAPADSAWCNHADTALQRRGYDPGMLRLVKLAALQAIGSSSARLSSIFVTPLPHLRGELLLRSSSGWTGRARAWVQQDCLLALAWQH